MLFRSKTINDTLGHEAGDVVLKVVARRLLASVRDSDTVARMIPVEEILFFRSDEKYTCVQTEKFEALIRKPVRDLAEELDPSLFWQIHRATLVNVNAIEGVTRDIRGRHLVLIKGRPDKLEVSRSFLHLFKQM